MDTKRITITVDKSLNTALKHLSVDENKNLSDLIISAINNEYSDKFNKMNIGNFDKDK